MENKKIKIDFGNSINVELDSELPDINEIVKTIVKERDKIDINKIEVTSENDNFDSEGFKQIIKDSFSKFIEEIKIDKNSIKNIQKKIDEIK